MFSKQRQGANRKGLCSSPLCPPMPRMGAARTPGPLSSVLKQTQSPEQETVPDLEGREARCVLLPLRSDVPLPFPMSSFRLEHGEDYECPSPHRELVTQGPPASIFQPCLWHILCSCRQASSEPCPLPGLHLNTESFLQDLSLSERAYIKRNCFQD